MTNKHFYPNSTLSGGSRWIFCWAVFATSLAGALGCGSNSQRLTQLQNENDRLLSEYRAQRDQVTQLSEKLAVAQNRLAESEKLLARQSPMPSGRLSRLNDPSSLPSGAPSGLSFSSQSRGTASGGSASTSASNNPKLRGDANGPSVSTSELNWRPMRRESP